MAPWCPLPQSQEQTNKVGPADSWQVSKAPPGPAPESTRDPERAGTNRESAFLAGGEISLGFCKFLGSCHSAGTAPVAAAVCRRQKGPCFRCFHTRSSDKTAISKNDTGILAFVSGGFCRSCRNSRLPAGARGAPARGAGRGGPHPHEPGRSQPDEPRE